MKYKAIITDVDGSLVPNGRHGMPSPRVKKAINRAGKSIHIGVASGRPLFLLDHIFSELNLTGPSIIRGGSQVIDTATRKIVWEKPMDKSDIQKIRTVAKKHNILLNIDVEDKHVRLADEASDITYGLFTNPQSLEDANAFIDALTTIPTIAAHPIPDWTEGKYAVNITHAEATKQHGIFEVAKILGIETHEIIGIGDGGNDFPLLMACGLKVAMGNAMEDVKAIADYIAPSVEEDGVADVIEKFVLKKLE